MLALAEHFGVDNICISNYESRNWNDSKAACNWLDKKLDHLNPGRIISLIQTSRTDEIGKPSVTSRRVEQERDCEESRLF